MKRNILIIGANSNIGAYLAERYFDQGMHLILHTHLHQEKIQHLLDKTRVLQISFDLQKYHEIHNTLTQLFQNQELIPDVLIICSTERSSDHKKLADSDKELCETIINTNILGTYYLLKTIIPYLRNKNLSHILLFSSNVTRIGLPQGAMYSASKAALANLVRSLAIEEAEYNILINAIAPGPVKIDDSHFSKEYQQFREDYYNKYLAKIPLKKLADLEDIYHTVNYLVSEENKYITGEEIFVTGGSL